MSRIQSTFEQLQAQGRKALIPYVVAGFPFADITPALMHGMVEAAPRFAGWALADALIEDQAARGLTPAVAVIVTEARGGVGALTRAAWQWAPAGTAIVAGRAGTEGFAHHFDDRTAGGGERGYVCRGVVCFAPSDTPDQLRAALWQPR